MLFVVFLRLLKGYVFMFFEVGEIVVYFYYGVVIIIEVKECIIKGEVKKYLKFNVI